MKRLLLAGAALIPMVALGTVGALILGVTSTFGQQSPTTAPVGCIVGVSDGPGAGAGWDAAQMRNAATIIAQGKADAIPPRGWVIAIEVSIVEAGLRNLASRRVPASLDYPHDGVAAGDLDSVGIVQQRTSWASVADRMNPAASIHRFYTGGDAGQRGLLDITGWEQMPTGVVAQAVQVSAFPDRYATHEAEATALVKALADGVDPGTCTPLATGPWTLPVAQGAYVLTAGFDDAGGHWSSGHHTGLDFAAPIGTPVMAASAGRVTYVGEGGPYGHHLVKIQHADGVETWYAHMSAAHAQVGQDVDPGSPIGEVGAEGNVTGPHLHLEVRVNGTPVDPKAWLVAHDVTP